MPAESPAQQRFMGAELARARAGKKTQTGMSASKLEEMAKKPRGGYKKKKKLPTRGSGELTPLGSRTLAGYQQKWGDKEGHDKFETAVANGTITAEKMFKNPDSARESLRKKAR